MPVELSYALFLFKPNAPSDIIAGEWEMPANSAVTAEAELTVKDTAVPGTGTPWATMDGMATDPIIATA